MFQRFSFWPLFAAIMGFALGGSFVWGVLYVPPGQYAAHNTQAYHDSTQQEHKNGFWEKASDDPVAYFTLWLVGFTGVLAVSTIGLWIVTWRASASQARDMQDSIQTADRSAIAAERAAEIANQTLIASERAWIIFKSVKIGEPITYDESGARIVFHYVLENTGHSPARFVWIHMACFTPLPGGKSTREVQKEELAKARLNIAFGQVLFPGQTFELSMAAHVPKTQIDQMAAGRHVTSTIFEVKDQRNLGPEIGQVMQPSELRVRPHFIGLYAD